jgi:hypothetical protein
LPPRSSPATKKRLAVIVAGKVDDSRIGRDPNATIFYEELQRLARSVLRHIRVTSKHELKERIMAGIDVNRHPVIHTWSYKLADAA